MSISKDAHTNTPKKKQSSFPHRDIGHEIIKKKKRYERTAETFLSM